MQQLLRRKLLALHHGPQAPEELRGRFEEFTRAVMAGRMEFRPLGDAVLDGLLGAGVTRELADEFVGRYEQSVWGAPVPVLAPA